MFSLFQKDIFLRWCYWVCSGMTLFWVMAVAANENSLIGVSVTDLTTREYNNDGSLFIQAHADQMYVDYERKGFFRIGALPKLVFENIQIEVESVQTLTNALSNLQTWGKTTTARQRVELKNAEIKIIGEKQPRLSAKAAHVLQDNTIELLGVSLNHTGEQPAFIPKAILHLTGSYAGKLCWNTDGHQDEAVVFGVKLQKTP